MSFTISKVVGLHLAAVGLLLSSAGAFAQQAPPAAPNRPRAVRPFERITANRPVDQARTADRDIAEWLGICDQEEVAISKLAASKAKDKDVREFAEMIAKDHNQQLAQLQQFGAQTASLEAAPAATQTRTTAASQGGIDFLEVKREVAQNCLASAKQKWNEEGMTKDCELGFVGAQLVAHHQMLETSKVLRKYASPELQKVIDQGIQATESHLKHAEKLLHSLASVDSKSNK